MAVRMSPENFKVSRRILRLAALEKVERGRARIRAAEAALDRDVLDAARAAREAGATWQEIGEAVGISMQGAQQKFGPSLN